MVEERLNSRLLAMGYQRMDSNTPGIYLYYLVGERDLNIVSVFHAMYGDELTAAQYEHILEQLKDSFHKSFPQTIRLLNLIVTKAPDKVKQLCLTTGEDNHWIIDLSANRLMIYEMQANNYAGISKMIEEILTQEELSAQEGNFKQDGNIKQEDIPTKEKMPSQEEYLSKEGHLAQEEYLNRQDFVPDTENKPFTLFNTVLIVINIIAFLLTQYTGLFGGDTQSFYQGSDNWYYVFQRKEYYRLITSMFMHGGWMHLLGNMFIMLFLGSTLERTIGRWRYLIIYFVTGIVAGLASDSYNMWKENAHFVFNNSAMSVGASGAIFGLVGAILYIVIVNRGRLEQISTRQVIIFTVLCIYNGVINTQVDQAAHIGGFISGILIAFIIYRRSHNDHFEGGPQQFG